MKIRRARSLAAKSYETFDTALASAALALLKHHKRRDRVTEGLAAFIKGVPQYLTIDGVTYTLLYGADGQPLQGGDGEYLYGGV